MTYNDAPLRGPSHDWYETSRAGQVDRREAAEQERRGHKRDDRGIAILLIVYMVAGGASAALVNAPVMGH